MYYLLNLSFEKNNHISKREIYYSILWAFLSLFEDQNEVYQSIVKLSFSLNNNFIIHVTIQGEKNYNSIITSLLKKREQGISLNGYIFTLTGIIFDFKVLNPQTLVYKEFDTFSLTFTSPTFTRTWNIINMLPLAERFLFSVYSKHSKILWLELNKEQESDFKTWLKHNIFIGKFDIKTAQITIKSWTKAGVIGSCKYYVKAEDNEQHLYYKKILFSVLKIIPFVGIGSSTKLGCGDVKVFN